VQQLTPDRAPISPPTVINHQTVVGAIPVPTGHGERCHQWIVMCHNPNEPPGTDYTTWQVACDATEHRTFVAVHGNPDLSAADAHADLTARAAARWPAPPQPAAATNTDADRDTDHGTEDTCEHCNGSGCPHVAATLTLTARIQVRRALGPAYDTPTILWALQDRIARVDEIDVKTAWYAITHVDYDLPDAAALPN
jgi:hypothetical protein